MPADPSTYCPVCGLAWQVRGCTKEKCNTPRVERLGFFKNGDGSDGPGMAGFRDVRARVTAKQRVARVGLGRRAKRPDGQEDVIVQIHWFKETAQVAGQPGVDHPWAALTLL